MIGAAQLWYVGSDGSMFWSRVKRDRTQVVMSVRLSHRAKHKALKARYPVIKLAMTAVDKEVTHRRGDMHLTDHLQESLSFLGIVPSSLPHRKPLFVLSQIARVVEAKEQRLNAA